MQRSYVHVCVCLCNPSLIYHHPSCFFPTGGTSMAWRRKAALIGLPWLDCRVFFDGSTCMLCAWMFADLDHRSRFLEIKLLVSLNFEALLICGSLWVLYNMYKPPRQGTKLFADSCTLGFHWEAFIALVLDLTFSSTSNTWSASDWLDPIEVLLIGWMDLPNEHAGKRFDFCEMFSGKQAVTQVMSWPKKDTALFHTTVVHCNLSNTVTQLLQGFNRDIVLHPMTGTLTKLPWISWEVPDLCFLVLTATPYSPYIKQ